ncbi:MAG: SDR family NAD(P)-dependent oxidoreductase [Myxococcales bacterium]
MTRLAGKVFAVTGAASGIGRALAVELAKRGAHVALSDVDQAGLAETLGMLRGPGQRSSHVVDVSDRASVERYAQEVSSQHGGADGIINNAGVTARASLEEISYEDFEFVINVNLWGVIYGVKSFLPLFRQRGAGHIVNISSINAMVPFALNGPYNISKYGVLGLSETLMQELEGSAIRTTCVHPGGIKTNIVRNSRGASKGDAKMFDRIARTSAAQAANVILDGVERNKRRVYVGADSKLMAVAKRAVPSLMVDLAGAATRQQMRRREKAV